MAYFIIALIVLVASMEKLAVTKKLINELKETVQWTVTDYYENIFRGWSVNDVKNMLGLLQPQIERTKTVSALNVPSSFDARQKWPNCLWPVRDQAHCGSCWAHGLSEFFSVRQCTFGGNAVELSPQDAVSCDKRNFILFCLLKSI